MTRLICCPDMGCFMKQVKKKHCTSFHFEPRHEKTFLCHMRANNKGADQPAHPRSLISTFVVRCLDSIIYLVNWKFHDSS